jgi:RHS repeat-associated protein
VRRFLFHDHLGSNVLVTGPGGDVIHRRVFEPFGQVVAETPPTEATAQLFTGQRLEATSGLYDLRARWYDPEAGRFLSVDPVVQDAFDPQLVNAYSYVRNNAPTLTDPDGRSIGGFQLGPLTVGLAGLGPLTGIVVDGDYVDVPPMAPPTPPSVDPPAPPDGSDGGLLAAASPSFGASSIHLAGWEGFIRSGPWPSPGWSVVLGRTADGLEELTVGWHMALGGYVFIPAGLIVAAPTLVAVFGFGGYGQLWRQSWGAGQAGLDLAGDGLQRAASGMSLGAIDPPH